MKTPEGAEVLKKICVQTGMLIYPFPKGVLGKGKILPDDILQKNLRLIYVKASTGMNLSSKYSQSKGHDINFWLYLCVVKIWSETREIICTTKFPGFLARRDSWGIENCGSSF